MVHQHAATSSAQQHFSDIAIGTLVYAVVLAFCNDYTNLVEARSFSTIFLAALTLSILTFYAFAIKTLIIKRLRHRRDTASRGLMVFSLWLVMFLSKFVFLGMLDALFGEYIRVRGFFGILFIVIAVTALQKLATFIYVRLGDKHIPT